MKLAEMERKNPQKDEFHMTARGRENSHSLLIDAGLFCWANAGSGDGERQREGKHSQGVWGAERCARTQLCGGTRTQHRVWKPRRCLVKCSALWVQFIARALPSESNPGLLYVLLLLFKNGWTSSFSIDALCLLLSSLEMYQKDCFTSAILSIYEAWAFAAQKWATAVADIIASSALMNQKWPKRDFTPSCLFLPFPK